MATQVATPPVYRRLFNVDDYYRMAEVGIFAPDERRLELIEGEIFKMSPIGTKHASCITRLTAIFGDGLKNAAQVSIQNPVRLDDLSEPEPDVMLLKPRKDFYAEAHPVPADVLLLIEVSDTTLRYDRTVKLPLYARSGIVEVWIVNLKKKVVEVYRKPKHGKYQESKTATAKEILKPQWVNFSITVKEILG